MSLDLERLQTLAEMSLGFGISQKEDREIDESLAGLTDEEVSAINGVVGPPATTADLEDAVAWWNMATVTGSVPDETGRGNNLTITGTGLTLDEGPGEGDDPNASILFDQSVEQHLDRAISPGADLDIYDGRPFTIVCWASFDNPGVATPLVLLNWMAAGADVLALKTPDALALAGSTGEFRWHLSQGVSPIYLPNPGLQLSGDWLMHVIQYDGSVEFSEDSRYEVWDTSNPNIRVSQLKGAASDISAIQPTSFNVGQAGTAAERFKGNVSRTAVFRRLLSYNEKLLLHNAGLGLNWPG